MVLWRLNEKIIYQSIFTYDISESIVVVTFLKKMCLLVRSEVDGGQGFV